MDAMKFVKAQWDRVAAWIAVAFGALLLFIGWLGVSDSVLPAEQLPYIISGGLGGIALVGIGAMLWLSADLRDEWTELHALARQLERADDNAAADRTPAAAVDVTPPAEDNRDGQRPLRVTAPRSPN
jgi:hypothetical protein